MENAQVRHKRFQRQEGEIANYANAFGILAAMERYDIRSVLTVQKIMERRGDGKTPAVDKRAMYPDGESYCQGVVKAIIHTVEEFKDTISNLADQLAGRDAIIAEKDKRIKQLQEEKQSFGALGCQKEETIMQELLSKIK